MDEYYWVGVWEWMSIKTSMWVMPLIDFTVNWGGGGGGGPSSGTLDVWCCATQRWWALLCCRCGPCCVVDVEQVMCSVALHSWGDWLGCVVLRYTVVGEPVCDVEHVMLHYTISDQQPLLRFLCSLNWWIEPLAKVNVSVNNTREVVRSFTLAYLHYGTNAIEWIWSCGQQTQQLLLHVTNYRLQQK